MSEWKERLKAFLAAMEYNAVSTSGTVSHEMAIAKAHQEYDKYRLIQDRTFVTDFDMFISGDDEPLLPFDVNHTN